MSTKRKSKVHNSNSNAVDEDNEHENAGATKHEWTTDELRSLIEQVTRFASGGKEREVSYKATRSRIDWSSVHIADRDEEDCRGTLIKVLKQVRTERSLQEVLGDARALLDRGALRVKEKHGKSASMCTCPDSLPKKPSLFLMYRDSVLLKVRQEHPGLSGTELMRIVGKMYKELNEKRKKRLTDEFKEREASYKASVEEVRSENPGFVCPVHHPDEATRRARSSRGRGAATDGSAHRGAPKAHRPVDLYIAKKLESKEVDDARREELTAKYTRKYEKLSDAKKLKWIKQAQAELETTYREAAIAYWKNKPKFKPVTDIKKLLTPDERRIIGDQKEKQPPSLYTFFTTRKLRELTDVKGTERLSVAAHMWKELTAADKEVLEVEWHRERGDTAEVKPSSKAVSVASKRKAAKSDDDSDSDLDTPKRGKFDAPVTTSSAKQTSKQPGVATPKLMQNAPASKPNAVNNNAAKAKQNAAPQRDVKPAASSSSEDDDDDDDDDDDEPPRQTVKSNAPSNAKNAPVTVKAAAKPVTVAKPANRPSAIMNGGSSSEDDDDSDSD